jgi:predicted nucleic acid-binding protein
MRYLLDTGIAQDLLGRNANVLQRADAARRAGSRIGICTPVLGELRSGKDTDLGAVPGLKVENWAER